MQTSNELSWGRYHNVEQDIESIDWRYENLPDCENSMLPYGNGRSYGDSCLNDKNTLIHTKHLKHLIAFDRETGLLRCESGVLLSEILAFCVFHDWFLPVTPGTKFATVGGCIANDVHGKNHHRAGNFGHHLRAFELLRSDGRRLRCSPAKNAEWFYATIGGLGLTGLVVWAEIQLKPIHNAFLQTESIRYQNIDEFRQLTSESAESYEYNVAWVDCMAKGKNLGRGLFIRANHCNELENVPKVPAPKSLTVPFNFPNWALNSWTIHWFNHLYYNKQAAKVKSNVSYYDPYFYPLDGIQQWNKIYGKRGFFQYQFVVPTDDYDVVKNIMGTISDAETGSFLTVLKEFGSIPSLGLLSFPRPGVTFALDFPNKGQSTLALMNRLDDIVRNAGGAVYPAKDARMSAQSFKAYYPKWEEFIPYIDPKFSSSFWRRVME